MPRRFWPGRILALAAALLAGGALPVSAAVPYESYNYIEKAGEMLRAPCPAPFVPLEVWDAASLGVPLGAPNDIFLAPDGDFYVVDTENSALLVISAQGELKRRVDTFMLDGEKQTFQKPEGVYVTDAGEVYVADTENNRVVVLDSRMEGIRAIAPAASDILGEGYIFYPRKVAVDGGGRLFVVARGQYNGIMQFTADGEFASFTGSNQVNPSAVELLWRRFMTKEQREKTAQLIPLEYTNLSLDGEGFLYAVTQATGESKKIKRLNPGGTDVLIRSDEAAASAITENAKIADICSDSDGNYYAVNQQDGGIYAYDGDGRLLYVFGDTGELVGTFQNPTAVEYAGDQLYVTDGVLGTVTVFRMTGYAKEMQTARRLYEESRYEESRACWERVLRQNSNCTLAYVQLGRICYRLEDYGKAMEYFKKGNFRGDIYVGGYGSALELYRAEFLRRHMGWIFTAVLVLAAAGAAAWLIVRYRRGKRRKGVGEHE